MASFVFGQLAVIELAHDKGYLILVLAMGVVVLFWWSFFSAKAAYFLTNPVLRWLGFISYPLYLIHQNFVTGAAIGWYLHHPGWPTWLYPLVPLLGMLALAHIMAKLEPWLRGVWRGRAMPAVQQSDTPPGAKVSKPL